VDLLTSLGLRHPLPRDEELGTAPDMPGAHPLKKVTGRLLSVLTDSVAEPLGRSQLERSLSPAVASLLDQRLAWGLDLFALGAALAATSGGPGPLAVLGAVLFEDHRLYEALSIPRHVLLAYLRRVEAAYQRVPYHNAQHAACVLHSCNYALVAGGLAPSLSRVELAAVLLAAAVHDVGHPGLTNAFLVASAAPLALRYNDRAVLESFHAATAFEMMREEGLDVCGGMQPRDAAALRRLVIHLVLATDTDQHEKLLSRARAAGPAGLRLQVGDEARRTLCLQLVLKFADLGNAAKPLACALRWAAAITAEFYAQGDEVRYLFFPGTSLQL